MEDGPAQRPVAACTIIARNYLAQARVLIDSYLNFAPDAPFYLFIVDGPPPGLRLQPTVRILGPEDVPVAGFREMSFKYDITELCTAVKPSLLQFVLSACEEPAIVYFDPDIVIFRELRELWDCLATSNTVLIPHLLDPIPLDGLFPDEKSILAAGAYNLGFVGVKASDETERLLQWWGERLKDNCRIDVANGLFVDQKWMDLVPSLFGGTTILRDDTYDVAYWNLHSRALTREGHQVFVNGRPLAFFHFSGYNPSYPRTLSKHQNRLSVVDDTALAYLLDTYAGLVFQRGFRLAQQWRYGYRCFGNGVPISPLHRHLYQSLDEADREAFGDPFRTDRDASFFSWSVTPSSAHRDVSPFLERLLVERPDIRDAIPEPWGRDRERFVRWAITDGAKQMGYDPVFADLELWGQAGGTTPSLMAPADSARAGLAGVNVCGYLRNETGLGAVTRGFIGALRASGVPVGLRDLGELSPNRSEDPTLEEIVERAPYDINLVCVNADQHFVVKSHLGAEFFRDRYNIGVWFWEQPTFPREWWDRFDEYDEVWATTSFIANALATVSPIPIVRIPPVLTSTLPASRESGRARLAVEPDEFVYLFTFDFASYFERKNPLAVIEAFRQSYAPGDRARLVIKCVNEHLDRPSFERMAACCADLPVSIHTGYWAANEMRDLTAACDAYVSLHRSEGLGLTIAEAMALGKPTIATAWSGNADFMTPANSFPVGYELVRLEQDFGPYRAGTQWAEPSISEASHSMRLVFEDRGLARSRGEAARRDIERDYSVERIGEIIQERLAIIMGRQRKGDSTRPGLEKASDEMQVNVADGESYGVAPEPDVLLESNGEGELDAVERGTPSQTVVFTPSTNGPAPVPFVPSMTLGQSSHGPFGVLAKRSVDFLLRYHTHYQSQLNLAFSDFMRELEARQSELRARQNELDVRQMERDRDIRELYRRSDLTAPDELLTMLARVEHLTMEARLLTGMSRRVEEVSARMDQIDARSDLAAEVAGLADRVEELTDRVQRADAVGEIRSLHAGAAGLQTKVDELKEQVEALRTAARAVGSWQGHAEGHLEALNSGLTAREEAAVALSGAVDQLTASVQRIQTDLEARPYMARDTFGALGDLERPMGFGIDAESRTSSAGPPPEFEDLFRGPEAFITERQRVYLPFFDGLERVVELGSGRGEFLDLLHERGIDATGVEQNEALVERSRKRGRRVELGDALEYLEAQPDGSFDAIFSAQVIEHFESARIPLLLRLAYAKLRPKGLLIAETVNPESHTALKTFYVDLSHVRPIFPQVLLHLCQEAGFASGRIFYPLGGGFTQTSYARAGEYALIALR